MSTKQIKNVCISNVDINRGYHTMQGSIELEPLRKLKKKL